MSAAAENAVFDPGLQPERTLLAWRRTCLSFGLASLVGMRFTVDTLGAAAVLIGACGAGLAAIATMLSAAEYRRVHRSLQRRHALGRSGLGMALATGAVLMFGALCAASVVHSAVHSSGKVPLS